MNTKDRYSGIQSLALNINKAACHFLCLLSIAEEERFRLGFDNPHIDLIEAIRISESKNWLRTSDFWVKDAPSILEHFTGKKWTRTKVEKLPSFIDNNQYTECNWYWKRKEGSKVIETEHFTRRSIDTLNDSQTKKNGVLRYYYIYTCQE